MKIGFDAKRIFHNTTGLGNYCRDMIRILSTSFPEHQYILYNPKPGKITRLIPDNKIILERTPSKWIWRILNSIWRQGPVISQAKKDGIAIYHGLSGELPRGIRLSGIKSVVTIHDLIFLSHPNLYKAVDRKIYLNKFQYAADHADIVVAISNFTRQEIIRHLGTDPNKIKVVYQTCHPIFKQSNNQEKWSTIKNQYDLPEEYILMVGTIERRKNALSLIKAIKDSSYQVVLIGHKTAYQNELISFIQSNKLTNQVHFIAGIQLEDLAVIYHQAKLMAYTSLVEGFGIPIIEALYTSTPVICHHEGVFPEAAGPGSTYIDMNNSFQIRAAIDEVWNNEAVQNKMISDGLEYVKMFDDSVIAHDMMQIYNSLIQ